MSLRKKILYSLAILLSFIYLLWRIFFTIPFHDGYLVLIFAVALVISEVISNFTAYVLILLKVFNKKDKIKNQNITYDVNEELPKIDILIVTHDEDVELLSKTVNAATFIDYPDKSKINIVICDDGNRQSVKELASKYNVQYIGLKDNKTAKSGNINHALSILNAPLFVIFDADMIPFSSFLNETVPLFMQNLKDVRNNPNNTKPLGFIQTPQSFYNADIFQFNLYSEKIVTNEQDFFSRDINIVNGNNDGALFTGSNALFLKEAVKEVGWFPTKTLTEDFELGVRINIAGYASMSTDTPQSSGITPVDISGVIKQRKRWARGVVKSCKNLHIFLNPKIKMINRLILCNVFFYWWSFLRRAIFIAAPILFALFDFKVINANFFLLMLIWAPGYFLLHFILGDSSSEIRDERMGEIQETFFAPYLIMPVILETLGISAKKFKVTDKAIKTSLKDKLYAIPYIILWILVLISIIKFNYGKWGFEIIMGSVVTFWLITHLINLTFCIFIALGRNIYRRGERFERKETGYVFDDRLNKWLEITTIDISDNGLSFVVKDNSLKMNLDNTLKLKLRYKNKDIDFFGKITRVFEYDEKIGFGVLIDITDEAKNYYYQLIYDGQNTYLPTKQDQWMTLSDVIMKNVAIRLEKIQQCLKNYKDKWVK